VKKSIETSTKRYVPRSPSCLTILAHDIVHGLAELKTSCESLKKMSDELAAFVAQVQLLMAGFRDERKDAAECLKS
jgi:hypothetical protein